MTSDGKLLVYYRPSAKNCALAEEDIVRLGATVTRSDENTTAAIPSTT